MTADGQDATPSVAVVIACYNQAHFLPDAIDSLLSQTRSADEIIVVDDGSSDETAAVAGRYPQATLVQQDNRGLAAARNRGWREARADFVVFLDADDRLLPEALSAGLAQLAGHPDCAFVAGHYRYIREDGSFLAEHAQEDIDSDAYSAFLKGNWVGMVASVMFRRDAVAAAGGFDESLPAGEDYDLYLRLSQQHPVFRYATVVAAYRQHGRNMSANIALMLPTILAVLRKNAPSPGDRPRRAAFRTGLAAWKAHYCDIHLTPVPRAAGARSRDTKAILRHAPGTLLSLAARHAWRQLRGAIRAPDGLASRLLDRLQRPKIGRVRFGTLGQALPSRADPAASLEAHYIAKYLTAVQPQLGACPCGTILFDTRFDTCLDGVATGDGWHAQPFDFSDPASEAQLLRALDELAASPPRDGIVALHCLSQAYDLSAALGCLKSALKPNGLLIATLPGGALGGPSEVQAYRRFTPAAVAKLFGGEDWSAADWTSYGNVLAATGALHGVPARDLAPQALQDRDPRYPLVIGMSTHRAAPSATGTGDAA